MPDIQPFRAIRYKLETPEELQRFVAPPYDMIDQSGVKRLYDQSPYNVVRIIQNQSQPQDVSNRQRHQRAAELFGTWTEQGVLQQDGTPRMYVYRQVFTIGEGDGKTEFSRTGLIARVQLHDFSEGVILPHENTLSAPKQDRYEQLEELKCNTEKIFGLVPDEGELYAAISSALPPEPEGVFVDGDNVRHELYSITDSSVIEQLQALVKPRQVLIADGHHRYETAVRFHQNTALPGNGHVMMTLVSMKDPGLVVRSFHRIVRKQSGISPEQMKSGLKEYFDIKETDASGPDGISSLLSDLDQQEMVYFDAQSKSIHRMSLNENGRKHLQEIGADHSPEWNLLNVSILNSIVVKSIFGLPLDGTVLHDVLEYVKGVQTAYETASDADRFYGCFFLRPIEMDKIRSVVEGGERMPQKSTNFFPKIYSGLVFNPLEPK